MKLNISNIPIKLPGYTNICSSNGDNIHNLEIENSCCTEILALDIIDYIPARLIHKVLKHWIDKLRHGGFIKLSGTDYVEIARAINFAELNSLELNQKIYGEQNDTWAFKTGMYTLPDVVDTLRSFGLKIIKQNLNNTDFYVEAQRP